MTSLKSRLFPEGFADDFLMSKYPIILKYHRLISSLFFISCMLLYLIVAGPIILRYLTLEAFLLTTIYFTLSFICYFVPKLKVVCAVLFEVIWGINSVVTLAYWSYLSDYTYEADEVIGSIVPHSIPFLMTLIDFILNEVKFYRLHYPFMIGYLAFYSICILLPYTLGVATVYRGITFDNWVSYVFLIGFSLFGLVMLEIGKQIKERCMCLRRETLRNDSYLKLRIND